MLGAFKKVKLFPFTRACLQDESVRHEIVYALTVQQMVKQIPKLLSFSMSRKEIMLHVMLGENSDTKQHKIFTKICAS
jgi:hypothetical protein